MENANGPAKLDANPLAGEGYVGAVDLGGTKILAVLFGPDGRIVSRAKKPTGKNHDPAVVIDRIAACVDEAARSAGIEAAELRAVGIGAPGPVDPENGSVRTAPNLGWNDVPLAAELERRLGVPVALDNDVRVAVIGENEVGAGRGVDNWVAFWPGTGIGGGIVIDGRILTGVRHAAGELGHITIKAGGPRCGCGGRGHLEALASRTAVTRDIAKQVKKGEKSLLSQIVKGGDVERAKGGDLAAAFEKGDKVVVKAIDRAAKYLAIGIASIANAINPELIVLGGGLVEAIGDPFVRRVQEEISGRPLAAATAELRVVRSALGDDAGATGAGLLARRLATHRALLPGGDEEGASASARSVAPAGATTAGTDGA